MSAITALPCAHTTSVSLSGAGVRPRHPSTTFTGRAWSCDIRLVVDDPAVSGPAAEDLVDLLARVEQQASRFRPDSVLSHANRHAGTPVPVPALLADLVAAALDAARDTGGLVDPTLGLPLCRLGYDRDIGELVPVEPGDPFPGGAGAGRTGSGGTGSGGTGTGGTGTGGRDAAAAAGNWRGVALDRGAGLLTVPAGVELDLGATAKAAVADLAARTLSARYRTPVLVELGGDVAVAGRGGNPWCVQVAERRGGPGQRVLLHRGGIATSTTALRRWRHRGAAAHHLLDPRTGRPATGPWRTVTVAAGSALAANVASTAALVLGADGPAWLAARGAHARLVGYDGTLRAVGGWPSVGAGAARVEGLR